MLTKEIMDTSEQYCKMRLAAIPDLGRGIPLESTFRSENTYVFENDEYSVFISRDGNFYTFHPSIEFSEQGRTCQLERQDQLQAMVKLHSILDSDIARLASLLSRFYQWYLNTANNFTSMEQLWLAFVMRNHSKKWGGDKWTSVNTVSAST